MQKRNSSLYIWIVFLLMQSVSVFSENGDIITHLKFKQLSTINGLPTDEVQKVYQDRDGFIWIATRYGLCSYDGYQMNSYKSNLYTPELLSNNNVYCLTDDDSYNIWIGTQEGLNVLNKATGVIRKGTFPQIGNNSVSCLLTTRNNTIWVGTDIGLFKYNADKDSMQLYAKQMTENVLPAVPIKSLLEDSQGDIWIGTWADGLYRYSPRINKFYAYPKMNKRNSAHVIYEDSNKNIWIGAWDEGLFLLKNPRNMKLVSWINYRYNSNDASSLSDNIVYGISEDLNTHTLWVGTRSGLSIMRFGEIGRFINYKSQKSTYQIPCNEINSLLRDRSGNMWLGTVGGGVFLADTRKPKFNLYSFDSTEDNIPTNAVRALFVDDEQSVWLGVGTYGVARHNRKTDCFSYYSHIPEFADAESIPTVYAIIQRKASGEIWFGTYDGGIYVYRHGEKVKHYTEENADFIKYICVTSLYEDRKGNCWVGTRNGLGVKRADGSGYLFERMMVDGKNLDMCYVRDITEDKEGHIWLATANYGIICVSGDIRHPLSMNYKNYSLENGKMGAKTVLCLHLDSRGRLWAGTEGSGLFFYNKNTDVFEERNILYNLPGDMVGSMEEDTHGNLWLGTNNGLVKLSVGSDVRKATLRVYTSADGLQDNFFIPKSSFNKNGELFFGGYKGYNSFFPDAMNDVVNDVPFFITDIKIYNKSLKSLDEKLRKQISSEMPSFTQLMELPYKYNNFSIEFASLTYKKPELNKYAYKLEGFDKEWQYTDATRHFAYYNNLKSGTYTFFLRATNENGVWSSQIRKMTVVVLPPFWATWWAYTLYFLALAAIVYYLYRVAKNRMILKNRLHLKEMEQSKAEELNHAKLQFFTNITHELLTPLTIISATVDELKMQAPLHDDLYTVMSSNIRRLIRLLQQILEFRKAETGNLKLRVSPGDLAVFVKNEAECFLPLVKKRKLHFSVLCDPDSITGYFDPDKLDKILYNLLSNAAKYNNEGGFVQVNLSYAQDKDYILLQIKDNGKGISEEAQKNLFKRFYEGDYRKFNTIGTGIGLSLTKDLVELHGGSIVVESAVGKGTTFFVTIPIDRSYFKEEEIDEETMPAQKTILGVEENINDSKRIDDVKAHSILVLEDNLDLLQLMVKLLGREYNVFTGENGKEGIEIIENEDIDLVVSDIMMPEMDGIELCKYVKSKLEFSHIPVILLTAKNTEEDRAEAYESGADGFISKPFNLTVLHARIKNLLKYKERMAHDFKNQLVFEVKDLNYTSIDEEFMQRAIDCVNKHLDNPDFDQPQFIEEMGTSKSTLYKKLKSLTGLNTSAFIRNIRLKAACRIMEEKRSIRVSELAYAVGFNDPKYFSSCFKKEFNMLPTEYIERFIPEKMTENESVEDSG
ncbi:two-component regulator propeller domain-containing protein [uncultured Bacteroides sp.]|uniref:hybrid sensor histidine kinase/response regulator transcription factor n=1 Tax=uncultured Bacteroides sp. TaxID=162156 RepID=UPI002AA8B0EB|nr:two-component regulator propeller domain-containing protein [uncultured Bacteroides sp.]